MIRMRRGMQRERHGRHWLAALVAVCWLGGVTAAAADHVDDLNAAIHSDDVDAVVKLLQAHPALVNDTQGGTKISPLRQAVVTGADFAIVQALVRHGADLQEVSPEGFSLAYLALRFSDARVANCLIEQGGSLAFVPQNGETLMHWAAAHGDATTIDLLAGKGLDLNAADGRGVVPVDWATNAANVATFTRLVELGAAVHTRGGNGNSLHHFLTICLRSGPPSTANQVAMVKKLIGLGCDPNELDGSKMTPLLLAMDPNYGDARLLTALLENGADPNVEANFAPPLEWAARYDNEEYVQLLLEHGADPWKKNANGDRALDMLLPAASGRSIFTMLRRLDAINRWRPERGAIVKLLYNAQYGAVDLAALAALLVLAVAVSVWVRRWVALQGGHLHGAGAEAALDQISARPDWRELLHKYETAQAFQRRVFLHRPWVLIGAIGWVGGLALMLFDPVLNLLVQPGAWWLAWIFTGTFLLGCALQFARGSAWRILGAALGIVTLAVSCFYCGVGVYLVWVYPQLYLLAVTFGAMVLATLTAAWRFHRTLKAEIALRRIKLPPELALARQAIDGAEIDVREGWDEGTVERMKDEG